MNIKYLIVDGSNIARELYGYDRGMPVRDLLKADNRHSKRLLKLIVALLRRLHIGQATVYFDGTARHQEIGVSDLPMSVSVGFGAGTQADDLIVMEAHRLVGTSSEVAVVTNDKELQRRLTCEGISTIIKSADLQPMAVSAGLNTELYFQPA